MFHNPVALLLIFLVKTQILIDALHWELTMFGHDSHEASSDVSDVIVLSEEFDMMVDGLIGVRMPEECTWVNKDGTQRF